MNTSNLENSKRLYELSGWGKTHMLYHKSANPMRALSTWIPITTEAYWSFVKESNGDEILTIPAYDLGYLLRKLPPSVYDGDNWIEINNALDYDLWQAHYTDGLEPISKATNKDLWLLTGGADTPEDAACLLAIKLFEEGILK